MKIPSYHDAEKSLDIRRRSKRGLVVSLNEHKFNQKLMFKYWDWAIATDPQVFNESVPFGSDISIPQKEFHYLETESETESNQSKS